MILILDVLNQYEDVLSDQMKSSLNKRLQQYYDELTVAGIPIENEMIEKRNMNQTLEKSTPIPKIIHYCWFGKGELSSLTKKCLESWKTYCPNYEIKEWNEQNFDISLNQFVREAYECKKYAFVSDYVRAYALYHEGGIYLDTDLELLKPLDEFLNQDAFSCFENPYFIQTALLGVRKGFPIIKELLDYYEDRPFIQNGMLDQTTNVSILSDICERHGLVRNGQAQSVDGFMIYPQDYFCPLYFDSDQTCFTDNTHAIHHFSKSWW